MYFISPLPTEEILKLSILASDETAVVSSVQLIFPLPLRSSILRISSISPCPGSIGVATGAFAFSSSSSSGAPT